MPKKKPVNKKDEKIKRREAELTAKRKQIIEFYITEGNYQKNVTARHFKDMNRASLYRMLQKYDIRTKEGEKDAWKRKRNGGRPAVFTEETIRKYEELSQMDPNISGVEAAQILNTTRSMICRIRAALRQRKLNGTSSSGVSVAVDGLGSSDNDDGEINEDATIDYNSDYEVGNVRDLEPEARPQHEESDVKPEPEAIRRKLKVKHLQNAKEKKESHRCLVCFESFQASIEKNTNVLENSLNVICFLKCLDLRSEDLVDFLKLSKGDHPKDWVSFCGRCSKLIKECLDIQSKIKKLERRLAECKENIVECITKSTTPSSRGTLVKEKVTKRIRETLRKQKRSVPLKSINPFEEGDKRAGSLIHNFASNSPTQASKVQVKLEVDESDDNYLPFHSDLEDTEDTIGEIPAVFANPASECSPPMLETYQSSVPALPQPQVSPLEEPKNLDGISQAISIALTSSADVKDNGNTLIGTNAISSPTPAANVNASAVGICDTCGMEMRPLALPMHQLLEHDKVMEGYTVKSCEQEGCDYKTLYDIHFRKHLKKHSDPLKKRCSFCGKSFHDRKKLVQHEEIYKNAETRPYVCEICGSSFAVRNYLYLHKRLSHEKRLFPSTNRKRPNTGPNQNETGGVQNPR